MDVEKWQAGHPWIHGWPGSTVGPEQIGVSSSGTSGTLAPAPYVEGAVSSTP